MAPYPYFQNGKLATSPINPNFKYSIADSLKPNEVNKEKAKELFAAAGLGEGTNLKIYTSDNQQRVNVATMMQDQLKDYGIGLSVERLEWGAFVDAVRNKEHDMFIMSWNPSIVEIPSLIKLSSSSLPKNVTFGSLPLFSEWKGWKSS